MRKIIETDITIKELVDRYPETLNLLVANGFEMFKDEAKINSVGKILKLKTALSSKGFDEETFIKLLEEKIFETKNIIDVTMKNKDSAGEISVKGLLPCPVRIPLLEHFDKFVIEYSEKYNRKISYNLEAASVGATFLQEELKDIKESSKLPDVFISAGFETFFDKKSIGKFKETHTFINPYFNEEVNENFTELNIVDPKGDYLIISVVPAVFMVNLIELGDKKIPETWEDLLSEEFYQKVCLPVMDFDLFNGILLNIYKEFGEKGVEKLGKVLLKSMHPAQMVKSAGKNVAEKPIVTVMPYFFTKMVKDVSSMKIVWPKDGAIISPIFMLIKREKIDLLKPISDFLYSKEVGEILSHRGLFPSLHGGVKNILPKNAKFKWLGWDYIYSNDIKELIDKTNKIFNNSVEVLV